MMEELFTYVTNPLWWFSVVFVGLALNDLSSHINPRLDSIVGNFSRAVRNQVEAKRNFRSQLEERARHDTSFQIIVGIELLRQRLMYFSLLATGFACMWLASTISSEGDHATVAWVFKSFLRFFAYGSLIMTIFHGRRAIRLYEIARISLRSNELVDCND